jgi:hypothetical protein
MTAAVFTGFFVDGWLGTIPSARPIPRVQLPEVKDAIVLELPVDEPVIGTASMFRMMEHRRPVVNGYSGHTPPHLRIVASGLQRADPTAILHFSESRPLFVVVNSQFDTNRWYEQFVRSLPGSQPIEGSGAGPVFLLPARPRPATAPPGALLQPVSVTYGGREHVTLDLGARRSVRTLSFPVRGNFDRVHPRMQVDTSDDGATWTTRWLDWTSGAAIAGALENEREIPLRIHLPDVETRYLRIHPAPAWMIRNLSIFAAR